MVELIKMLEEEFNDYKAFCIEDLAQVLARNFKMSVNEAADSSKRQINALLKDGFNTKGHFLFDVVDKETKEKIGVLWIKVNDKKAFICDIRIDEKYRGKGYGKRTLNKLEEFLREMGARYIGLNVWADNKIAFELYKKMGYTISNMSMFKEI